MTSHFRNNLRFALRKEISTIREELPLNKMERIGNILSWFAYDFKEILKKNIFDPRVLTIFFTAFAMTSSAFLFYPSITGRIISVNIDKFFELVDWDYVRFCLWFISEITLFGIGIRAFGRFTNQHLLKYYKDQNVVS
jgi:hypothetical protein